MRFLGSVPELSSTSATAHCPDEHRGPSSLYWLRICLDGCEPATNVPHQSIHSSQLKQTSMPTFVDSLHQKSKASGNFQNFPTILMPPLRILFPFSLLWTAKQKSAPT